MDRDTTGTPFSQYALIEIQKRMLLISADEMHSLNTFHDAIAEQEAPDETQPYHVCYGCYMPQPGIDEATALEDFKTAHDHWIGYIQDGACHIIAFHDAEPMEVEHLGRVIRIPFAALVQAHAPVIEQIGDTASAQAVTGFLRYASMSPATNILNRPGVIALKGIERRAKFGLLKPADWRKHIDRDRAGRAAGAIKYIDHDGTRHAGAVK